MEKPDGITELTFLETILLLGLDDKGWFGNSENSIKFGLAGAILFELVQLGRIEIAEGKVHVLNAQSTSDPVMDRVLNLVKSTKKEHSLRSWIQRFVYKKLMLRKTLINSLLAKKVIKKEEYSLLWVFYQFKYPLQNPALKRKIQENLYERILEGKKLSDHDLMLLAVMNTCKMSRKNFRHFENNAKVIRRIREITRFDEPSNKNVQLIKELQAAITRAIAASNVVIHA